MHVVKAIPYHRNVTRGLNAVRYISHREERAAGGETRELYGVGDRYKAISMAYANPADRERALRQALEGDAAKILAAGRHPTFHHHVFSVDDRAARQLATMPRPEAERTMRDALQKAFRATAEGRKLEGVYAIHWHSKARQDHPHIHVVYSPRRSHDTVDTYISRRAIGSLKQTWNREIDRKLLPGPEPKRGPRPYRRPRPAVVVDRTVEAVRHPARAAAGLVVNAVARRVPGAGTALTILRTGAALVRTPIQSTARLVARRALAVVVPVPPALVRGTVNIIIGRDR